MPGDDLLFKAEVVEKIVRGSPEEALKMLCKYYRVELPRIQVGAVKGRSGDTLGVYVSRRRTIYVRSSDLLYDPFVVIHEFYHHLRTRLKKHRGTERHADTFAREFIQAYRRVRSK